MASRWDHLVSESQFASHLVVTGIKELCIVPIRSDDWPVGESQKFPLHVGLHSYASGIERLCKLTIACDGYVKTGNFPSLRKFSHRIGDLLDHVESLGYSDLETHGEAVQRPASALDEDLTRLIERYASGSGRYEHLDSLWNADAEVASLDTWTELCGKTPVPERVRHLIAMRDAVLEAIRAACRDGDLEASLYPVLQPVDPYISEMSSALALRLYETARWVAATLDAATYYTTQDLPLLGECVQDLKPPADRFFQYSVALIEDEYVTEEELEAHYKARPPDEDE